MTATTEPNFRAHHRARRPPSAHRRRRRRRDAPRQGRVAQRAAPVDAAARRPAAPAQAGPGLGRRARGRVHARPGRGAAARRGPIDQAVPALQDGSVTPLVLMGSAYLVAAVLGGVAAGAYVRAAARIAQAVLLDLRRRVFRQTQRLSLEFHESYTSGRIISRQTSDLEALRELLDGGLTGVVSSLLLMVFTFGFLFFVDWRSGAGARRGVRPGMAAHALVPAHVAAVLPGAADGVGAAHREVRRDDDGHARGAGVPPRAHHRGRVRQARRGLPRRQPADLRRQRPVPAGPDPDRQPDRRGGPRDRRLARARRDAGGRRAGGRAAVLQAILPARAAARHVLQLVPVRDGGAGKGVGSALGGADRDRADEAHAAAPVRRAGAGRRSGSTACGSSTATVPWSCPTWTSRSPQARPWPSWAPPAPASRRWPSW